MTISPAWILSKITYMQGGLDRDADGNYLVKDVHYIDDYATEACNGSNPDFEEPLNAKWEFKEM